MQAMALDYDDHCKTAAVEATRACSRRSTRGRRASLSARLDSDDPRIRYAALQSLRKISGKDLGVEGRAVAALRARQARREDRPAEHRRGPRSGLARPGDIDGLAAAGCLAGVGRARGRRGAGRRSPDEFDMPYLASKPAAPVQQAPGQTPLPAPRRQRGRRGSSRRSSAIEPLHAGLFLGGTATSLSAM